MSMKNRGSSHPVHVHVSEATPVHVHVKTPTKSPQGGKVCQEQGILRPTAKVKTRGPWTPTGKTSLRHASLQFEGPTHCLEIIPQTTQESEELQSALSLADLTSDDDGMNGHVNLHKKQTTVGSLRKQVELKKKEQQLKRQSEHEGDCSLCDKDSLLKKLIEAEVDGKSASKQVVALSEYVSKMDASGGGELSLESSHLAHHKDLLLQKLDTFAATNRALRLLLREHHNRYIDSTPQSEQKETLLKELSYTEAENASLVVKLQEKQSLIHDLCEALDREKVNSKSVSEISKSVQSTRAHLQSQLRSKEAENNRLTVQIKNLERLVNEQRAEMDHLTEQLMGLKQQTIADREALKRAAVVHKKRAESNENTSTQLQSQLYNMEKQVTEALSAAETWRKRHKEDVKDKNNLELEMLSLHSRIVELSEQLRRAEEKGRADRDALAQHLHQLTSEGTTAKVENQSLKAAVSTLEEKLTLSQTELQHVKLTIEEYESLIDSYKIQVCKTRAEADDYSTRLARAEQDALTVRKKLDQELQHMQQDLKGKLTELEPLPEALCHVELKLQEVQDRESNQEMYRKELEATINELRLKAESENNQTELLKQKNQRLLEENRKLQHNVEIMERKMEESTNQNGELLTVVAKWENALECSQLRLEEKNQECLLLNQKLQDALTDAQQQVSGIIERAADKERSTQSKILELETQLIRTTSEINQMRHSKVEAEQRYQSQLQDVKDRLEQSDSTNRSLQNYVQFLKASYTNVFGDFSLSSSFHHSF